MGRAARLRAVAVAAFAIAAGGCLSVPSAGDDGDGCPPIVDRDFTVEAPEPDEWQLYQEAERSTATHVPSAGVLLRAEGLSAGPSAYAELATLQASDAAESEALVDAVVQLPGPSSSFEITWVGQAATLTIELGDEAVEGFREDGGDPPIPLCATLDCPASASGKWTFALRQIGEEMEVGAARDGDPVEYFGTTTPLGGPIRLEISAYADTDGEVAEGTVEGVRWRRCASAR